MAEPTLPTTTRTSSQHSTCTHAPAAGRRACSETTAGARYLYDPAAHSLTNRKSGRSGDADFVLSFDRELYLDAGAAYMFATLASVSLWIGTGSQLVSCPIQENLYFGIRDVR
jgi:hypothetical protein